LASGNAGVPWRGTRAPRDRHAPAAAAAPPAPTRRAAPPRSHASTRPHAATRSDITQSRPPAPAPRQAAGGETASRTQAPGLARPRQATVAPADAGVGDERAL